MNLIKKLLAVTLSLIISFSAVSASAVSAAPVSAQSVSELNSKEADISDDGTDKDNTEDEDSEAQPEPAESLVCEDGVWYYTVNGEKASATTLVYYYGTWYYVEDGILNFNATTLCYYYGTWYYVENGILNFNTTLCYYYGTWYYVENGEVNWNATTLCYYYGTWYYVENGEINWNAATLCYYYGTWYYVENGVVNWNATTLCYYYGTWYYVENGILNFNTTLCYYYGTWYYVENGEVNWNAATLCYYYGTWYYVENGEVNWNATTLCYYYGTWYYVRNGVLNFNITTSHNYYGTWYNVVNGVVVFDLAYPAPKPVNYIDVGHGYIAEIVEYNAETFDGRVTSGKEVDWSDPRNNYLPKGTVDYCSESDLNCQIGKESVNYVTLRTGYRVYRERKDKPYTELKPVVNKYYGNLPDHNEINSVGFTDNGTHTVIAFDTLWKAPFHFDILPQNYVNPSSQDFRVAKVTCEYIDITFCYATVFSGDITVPESNPIFRGSQLIINSNDITLRLFLKKQGGFYGWDAYYNDYGQLCFEFLNPKTVYNNGYGTNLNGAVILIDVGHGGIDGGASGSNSDHDEAERNLNLAYKIKAELENAGAVVYMTRSDDSISSTDDKINLLREIKPDFCIAVHHDSSSNKTANGFSPYYSTPFSKNAAEYIYAETRNLTSVYKKFYETRWHYYFMCRATNCPVVLTENGFMSNSYDYGNILDESKNNEKAQAIARGIIDYFVSIQ